MCHGGQAAARVNPAVECIGSRTLAGDMVNRGYWGLIRLLEKYNRTGHFKTFAGNPLLRPYFFHNRTLFSDISRLIFDLIRDYYNEVASRQITTGLILSHQTFEDFARPNPHWHGILIEGGFDDEGNFVYLPISSTKQMAELFRRKVIWYFEKNKLINPAQ